VIAGISVAVIAAGVAAWWAQHRPKEEVQQETAVTAPALAAQPQTTGAVAPPAAQPQTANAPAPAAQPAQDKRSLDALINKSVPSPPGTRTQTAATAPVAEKEESHERANVGPLTAAQENTLKPGDSFKECSDCPEMIVVPAGRFLMGSPSGQGVDEHPQHEVTIAKPFAVAKFALTFDEWDTCAARAGCRRDVSDEGWGRGRRPVINVSWDDAQAYVKWLSGVTGKPYRLLSEAEREYAARAGTETKYPWGDDVLLNGKPMANCDGCGSQRGGGKQTAPVGTFAANAFRLYDMVGNVWEWTEDCWNASYQFAPADGSPWTDDYCTRRVIRGGAWDYSPPTLRSANRDTVPTDSRSDALGFRVARTLSP
jgi:formylglycine-generating enzyme required for sulfatase activity